jgi:hypothetical protein
LLTFGENSQPWMAKSLANPEGCEQDASNNYATNGAQYLTTAMAQ